MSRPRRRPGELVAEAALIVGSILLAFALNGWWESRQDRRLADRAMASFEQEIRQNRENLVRVMPYHGELLEMFSEMSIAGSVRTFEDVRGLEGFQGFQPAFLTTSAWSTAIATGALIHLDYDVVSALSALYTLQDRFDRTSDFRALLGPGALSDANIASTVFSAEIYLIDVTYGARELVEAYDHVLELLAVRAGRGDRAARSRPAADEGARR
jgi:hypothetical protein